MSILRTTTLRAAVVAASIVSVAAAAGPSGAFAATATSTPAPLAGQRLALCQNQGRIETSNRITVLGDLATRIAGARDLTASHRGTLSSLVSTDRSAMQTLAAKIAADTDIGTCRTDVQSIVTGYRVYVLVVPQVHLVIAADRLATAATHLGSVEQRLQAAVTAHHLTGDALAKADAALADMTAKVASATATTAAVPATVLALTPAQYPGTTDTLRSARTSLGGALTALGAAVADATTVVGLLV